MSGSKRDCKPILTRNFWKKTDKHFARLCFIIVFICDLFVPRDYPLMS